MAVTTCSVGGKAMAPCSPEGSVGMVGVGMVPSDRAAAVGPATAMPAVGIAASGRATDIAGAGMAVLTALVPTGAFWPTARRSIQPPRDAQPLQPLLGAVCHICHKAWSEPRDTARGAGAAPGPHPRGRARASGPRGGRPPPPPGPPQPLQPLLGAVCH